MTAGSKSPQSSAIRTALALLLPTSGKSLQSANRAAIHLLVPAGLLIGLLYVGLYRAGWRIFGEVGGVRLMPALAVWLIDTAVLGLPLILGTVRVADHWRGEPGASTPDWGRQVGLAGLIALGMILVSKFALWTAIPLGVEGWPADWRRHLNFLYPRSVFRPLILAPMWGRWGLILAAGIGRTAPSDAKRLVGFEGARSLTNVLGWFLPVMLLTMVYCGRHWRWTIGCVISLAVLAVTFLFAVVTARHFSGHTRASVYAAGLVSEVAFLVFYSAAAQRIFYY